MIFDLDGTIIDTRRVYTKATQELFPNLSEKESLDFGLKIGQEISKYGLNSVKSLNKQKFTIWLESWYKYQEAYSNLFEDFFPLINTIKERSLLTAVNTNRPHSKERVVDFLGKLNIDSFFDLVLTAGDIGKRKPDPDGLLQICRTFDIPVSQAIFIGDSIEDVLSGKNANMDVIALSTGVFSRKHLEKINPYLICDSLEEIQMFIQNNFR